MSNTLTIFYLLFLINYSYADTPEWTSEHGRKVIGGDIIHLGVAEDNSREVATFKAENAAIKRLLMECIIPHKEIKIWDRFTEETSDGFKSFARAGLSFSDCDEAKSARGKMVEQITNQSIK